MIAKVCDGCDVVKQLKDIVHDNLNVFVGACIDPPNICLVWHYCPKGSLQVSHSTTVLLRFFVLYQFCLEQGIHWQR